MTAQSQGICAHRRSRCAAHSLQGWTSQRGVSSGPSEAGAVDLRGMGAACREPTAPSTRTRQDSTHGRWRGGPAGCPSGLTFPWPRLSSRKKTQLFQCQSVCLTFRSKGNRHVPHRCSHVFSRGPDKRGPSGDGDCRAPPHRRPESAGDAGQPRSVSMCPHCTSAGWPPKHLHGGQRSGSPEASGEQETDYLYPEKGRRGKASS